MSYQIGSNPIDEETQCFLKFHQWTIYDSENWTQSGHLYWNATTKNFEVIPDTTSLRGKEESEEKGKEEIIENILVKNAVKNIRPIIPRKK